MERPSIGWSSSGIYPRIWLDMPVFDSNGAIDQLQRELTAALPEGETAMASRGERHMTVLHEGRPNELLAEVRKAGADIDLPRFLRLMEKMISDWRQEDLDLPQSLPVQGIELFGSPRSPVVVLTLTADEKLLKVRNKLWRRQEEFLADCGVSDVDAFVKRSGALRTGRPEDYRAHVAVLRAPAGYRLPKVKLPLLVQLGGLQYHGVAFLPQQ